MGVDMVDEDFEWTMTLRWVLNFVFMSVANVSFYYLLWLMNKWAKDGFHIFWDLKILQIDFYVSNFYLFIMTATLITLPLNYLAQLPFNAGYLGAAESGGSLKLSQFMLWLSAPISYTIFVLWKLRAEEPIHWVGFGVAVFFLILAQLAIRFIKI